ncbi:hypothetical protein, conserved [Eimeria necatrix]|uniref:Ribosomal protein S15 n=1 Tax=Eimeria necatrix TaxID=51315 RepID=U6MVQ5_9EIME|nr:hypothetical protein, conserved [Eimeria necatrix]CDJ68031.1 hypothetical protein, conserved [Eimeria necatrix]
MMQHRKDFSTLRGLKVLVARRRKLLQYLGSRDFDRYAQVLRLLNLKPVYLPGSMDLLLPERRYFGKPKTDKDKKRKEAALKKAKALKALKERQEKRAAEERRQQQQLRVRPSLLQKIFEFEDS